MPTPMYVYAEIAARYGVDPKDDAAVEDFFKNKAKLLSQQDKEAIFAELLRWDGEVGGADDV